MPPLEAEGAAASPTAVAWNWVIEALAEVKECSILTLAELVSNVPGILKDPYSGATARERVALRFLEECVDSTFKGLEAPSSSLAEDGMDGAAFDVNQRCEDVLCCFLRKVRTLGSSEILKDAAHVNGLHKFILQKKTTLPKVSLGLLNEAEDLLEYSPSLPGDNGDLTKIKVVSTSNKQKHVEVLKSAKDVPMDTNLVSDGKLSQNKLSEHHKHLATNDLVGHRGLFGADGYNADSERHGGALESSENNSVMHKDEALNGTKSSLMPSNLNGCSPEHDKLSDMVSDEDGSMHAMPTIDVQTKFFLAEKCKISSSQNSLNNGLFTEEGTERRVCIKCDEDGQLLLCAEVDCPISIHENCLGSTACFDDKGDFYCPFCSYIRAATSYCEAKKKVSIARKTLSSFISWGPDQKRALQQPMLKTSSSLKKLAKKIHIDHEKKDASDLLGHTLQDKKLGDPVANSIDNTDRDNPDNVADNGACIGDKQEALPEQVDLINCDPLPNPVNVDEHVLPEVGDDNSDQQSAGVQKNKQIECAEKINSINLSFGQDEVITSNIAVDSFHDDTNKKHKRTENGKHPRDFQNQVQEEAANSCSDHSTSEEKESLENTTKRRRKDVCTPKEGNHSSSKYKAPKSYAKRYANSVLPFGRRNKLPWTVEEEEALKDAVQKFLPSNKGGFPWTKVLEHGRHMFHRTRQPMDLKDKWRNIQKKEERAQGR